MITEDQYRKLKKEVEDAKAEADRAQGAMDQLMQRLKDDFSCDSIDSATRFLKKLQKEAEEAEGEFEKALEIYRKKWKKGEEE